MEHLAAAEGEELARQGGAALADLLDLPQVLAGRLVAGEPGERQLGLAGDGGEQVVEHVGDAARQPAHRVHALRLGGDLLPDGGSPPAGPRFSPLRGSGPPPPLPRGCCCSDVCAWSLSFGTPERAPVAGTGLSYLPPGGFLRSLLLKICRIRSSLGGRRGYRVGSSGAGGASTCFRRRARLRLVILRMLEGL